MRDTICIVTQSLNVVFEWTVKSQSAVLSFFKPHENLYNKTPLVVIEEHVSYLNMQIDIGIVLIIWQSKGVYPCVYVSVAADH